MPSPLSVADGLFATKGKAVPLDKTRPEGTSTDAALGFSAIEADGETATLPGLFADDPDETAADGAATGTDPGEPPPAASLLTIAKQASAARSRNAARAVPEPETKTIPDTAKQADDLEPDAANQNDTTPGTPVYLPVPDSINLPSVVASPDRPKPLRYGKTALLAASIAVLVIGSVALYPARTPPLSQSAGTGRPQPAERDAGPAGASEPGSQPEAVTVPDPQKADIASVRFENAGRIVVDGTAPPETELIVLRNRRPLGTARSGPGGAWTFSATVPPQTQQHEISVVPLRIDTRVLVDQPSFVPRPKRRPALPSSGRGAGSAQYFIQIASLPTAADAGREAGKLTSRLSEAFAPNRISVRGATIDRGRKVYRIAIDGFATKESAIAACDRIRVLKTPCLVMQEPRTADLQ